MSWKEIPLQTLIADKPPIVPIPEVTKTKEVLELMASRGFDALPVMRSSSSSSSSFLLAPPFPLDGKERGREGDVCIGIVNIFDITNYVVSFILKEGMGRTEEDIESSVREHLGSPIVECLGSRESMQIWKFDAHDKIGKVLEIFSKGIQRILITHEGLPLTFLTQTDLVRFLSSQKGNIPSSSRGGDSQKGNPLDYSLPIDRLGLFKGPTKVLIMYEDRPAITGCALMAIHGVRAIPIVNLEGRVATSLGVNNLRGLQASQLRKLALPLREFLKIQSSGDIQQSLGKRNSTLEELLSKITENGIQRVWILDERGKILGLVTLTDVIALFAAL